MSQTQGYGGVPIPKPEICPHLGIEEDQQTCLAYPSPWNFCHHARPVAVVRLNHQHTTCLSAAHGGCPVFMEAQAAPLPLELRGHRKSAG